MSTKNLRLGLYGTKVGMTTVYEGGVRVGVTVVRVGPNTVLQRKTTESDGYSAIQVGHGTRRPKLVNKPEAGHFLKAGLDPEHFPRFSREIRVDATWADKLASAPALPLTLFEAGDAVDVVGTSKGRGFQGVMKRYHFSGFPASHGTHEYFRHPGSIGCRTDPGRVHKGKRMGGHMGNERVTVQNLKVVQVIPEKGLLLIQGGLPGPNGGVVFIRGAVKRQPKSVEKALGA